MVKKLTSTSYEKVSGIILPGNALKIIKPNSFKPLSDITAGGDAPKDVIRMYIYDGQIKRQFPKTWPTYIAKIGHKWYPNESITEQLITEIGKAFGMKIAHSELVVIEETVRFCSRHFHSKKQVLTHGAEILSRFIDEKNNDWIEELDKKNEIKEFINIKDIIDAIEARFASNSKEIIHDLINMLLFDALVGNNDRHYYNWGVITHLEGKHLPYFSPVYDTARGLWWNNSDEFVLSLQKDIAARKKRVRKYVKNSVPKIGVPNNKRCNHFHLLKYLKENGFITSKHQKEWKDRDNLREVCELIDERFHKLMIAERRTLIKETLECRFTEINNII